jgi:hypothetical protein
MRDAQLGKTSTEETRGKMRDAHLGDKNHFFGKIHTKETKRRIGDRNIGNKFRVGKTHTENTIDKMSKKVCVYGSIYNSSQKASNAIRFLYGFKSNFIKKWVNSPKYQDIFYVS